MKAELVLASLLLSSLTAVAKVPSGLEALQLVVITNDQDSKKTYLSVLVDKDNNVAGLYSAGGEGTPDAFYVKDIEKKEGVPLVKRGRHTLITLNGRLDRKTQQGKFTARYLVNGLTGYREPCEFEIRRKDGKYAVRNVYTKKSVSKVHVTTSSLGIKELQGLCPTGK